MNLFVFSLTVYHLMYVCKTETKGEKAKKNISSDEFL